IRAAIGAVLYPIQLLALKPVQLAIGSGRYFEELQSAQAREESARKTLALQAERASQADTLAKENARLRSVLELRQITPTPSKAAEVLYDAADPYTRKLIIDQGMASGIAAGSPVIDERGVLGQVTQVLPFTSEITLVTDRDLAIPVQNVRTGVRNLAFGDASAHGGGLELRFVAPSSDVQEGDVLTTSGVDGVYPPGLAVAKIDRIERRADSAFARIYCVPMAQVTAARFVLVLSPVGVQSPNPPAVAGDGTPAASGKTDKPASKPAKADKASVKDDKGAAKATPKPVRKPAAPKEEPAR
ncbi:MAG: rod shape-determining protein MreC, partial [Gammaproteobacteria bacterium]|nr:rod shape-determining protein MreC [Gammaproteobacteria bacterium]